MEKIKNVLNDIEEDEIQQYEELDGMMQFNEIL